MTLKITTVDKYLNELKDNHSKFKRKRNVTEEQLTEYARQQVDITTLLLRELLAKKGFSVETDISVTLDQKVADKDDAKTKRKILSDELAAIGVKEDSMSFKALMYVFDNAKDLSALETDTEIAIAEAMGVKKNVLASALNGVIKKYINHSADTNVQILQYPYGDRLVLIRNIITFANTYAISRKIEIR